MKQLLLSEGQERKRIGQDSASNNGKEWLAHAAAAIDWLSTQVDFMTSDGLHAEMEARGIEEPHHHNLWACAFTAAARRGVIIKTRETMPSRRPKANYREIRIWQTRSKP